MHTFRSKHEFVLRLLRSPHGSNKLLDGGNVASAALQLTIPRNARQSLPDNDNTPEKAVPGLSCVLHKKCVDGGGEECSSRVGTSIMDQSERVAVPDALVSTYHDVRKTWD